MKKLKVGLIGLGKRGYDVLSDVLCFVDNIEITALCDVYEDRIKKASDFINETCGYRPELESLDYKDVADSENVDAVIIFAAWEFHTPIAVYAMKKKKAVGLEVGGAYSIDQCWELVKTYEETKTPIMMLENCCYGRIELMLLKMVKDGVFGTVSHCDGAYAHDLRAEVADGVKNRHYRLRNYKKRNCDNYPTHELGPIAQMLNINRGNRMVSLVSMSSKSAGMKEFIKNNRSDDEDLLNTEFVQGDVVTTIIKCAGGETIKLSLDTTLPRYYSRGLTVHGTKAFYEEMTDSFVFDGEPHSEFEWKESWGNAEKYRQEKFEHPIWKQYLKEGVKRGHGGMDWLVFTDFINCVIENKPMPIDVYDAASWMSIAPLSEKSIQLGSALVEIPDFTNGKWVLK